MQRNDLFLSVLCIVTVHLLKTFFFTNNNTTAKLYAAKIASLNITIFFETKKLRNNNYKNFKLLINVETVIYLQSCCIVKL